jgi:tRNA-dependent cyclodipeptide synthase
MSGSRYTGMPPQNGPYIVKVKNGAGWRDYTIARLQISVGKAQHEGEKFQSTLEWASYRFEKVIICVNDTLQRFNLMYENPDMDEQTALSESFRAGREWLLRNFPSIGKLPSFSLHHWEEWKQNPFYANNRLILERLYQDSPDFRQAVRRNINEHWRRKEKSSGTDNPNFERFAEYSTYYLLEETAIFSLMYEAETAADIYPGTLLLPVQFLQRAETASNLPGIGKSHHTRIDFIKNSAYMAKAA